jgi:hypothetical protein
VKRAGAWVAIGVVTCAMAGCATSYRPLTPSASVTTTSPAADHWFRLSWDVEPEGPTARRIEGYVYNAYGRPAVNVQLLTQALDAAGAVIDQRLSWVVGGVPQLSRGYFAVSHLPVADHYRVTVWAFDFVDTPRRRFP